MKGNTILNLHRAIAELPTYQAPESIWQQVEQDLEKCEAYTFPDTTSLDAHMDRLQTNLLEAAQQQQVILKQAIRALPQYQAEKDVFDQIIQRPKGNKISYQRIIYWTSGIAASILLLLAWLWMDKSVNNTGQVKLTYTQETLTPFNWKQFSATPGSKDEVLSFIEQHCIQATQKCQEPKFKGLYDAYIQLQEAKTELQSQLEQHQNQPELVKYLIRVEKQQTEVGKQLIQQLLS
jgi:hypothetical protein